MVNDLKDRTKILGREPLGRNFGQRALDPAFASEHRANLPKGFTSRFTLLSFLRYERSVCFTENAHAATRRSIAEQTTVSNRSSSFSRVDWCKKPRGFPPEFTPIAHNNPLLEWFLRLSMVVLLRIGGKCSHFRAKAAHISGHLPCVKGRKQVHCSLSWVLVLQTKRFARLSRKGGSSTRTWLEVGLLVNTEARFPKPPKQV
jgi:hypothetical protein